MMAVHCRTNSLNTMVKSTSRPSSSSSSNKNSMVRLPDEPPIVLGGSLPVPLCTVRPVSSHKLERPGPAVILRLPDEPVPTCQTPQQAAPPAATKEATAVRKKTTSLRLQTEEKTCKTKTAEFQDGQPPIFKPPSAAQSSTRRPVVCTAATSANRACALRDRLNKTLTVSTLQGHLDQSNSKFFRMLRPDETICDYYSFNEEVYSGGAKGKVVNAKRKSDDAEVIVKIRTKRSNRSSERAWRTIMSQVHRIKGSRHVLDITEIVEDDSAFYVIMPRCNGGELFEFLITETEVPEAECKRIIREILVAVGHLHRGGLVHRDVKPENILFDVDRKDIRSPKTVKLIDFDTCMEWTPASPKSNRFVGTPGYIAPEALLGEITPQSDIWSIGVILYILMTGESPWTSLVSIEDGAVGSPGAKMMYNAIKAEVLEWDKDPWPEFPLARDLCQKMMSFNVEDRPLNVQEVLSHPWLKETQDSAKGE